MVSEKKHNIIFDLGHVFKSSTRTASKILVFISSLAIYVGFTMDALIMSFGGFLLLLVCVLILNYKSSVEINFDTNQFRECGQLFFYKSGKWRKLASYTDVAILTTRKVIKNELFLGVNQGSVYGTSQNVIKYNEKETAVYLLTPSHRYRVLLKVCDNLKSVDVFATDVAIVLNKTYTIFNPEISQASKNKRR